MKILNKCINKIGFNITRFAMKNGEKFFDIAAKIYLSRPVGSITRDIFFRLTIKLIDFCMASAKLNYIYLNRV